MKSSIHKIFIESSINHLEENLHRVALCIKQLDNETLWLSPNKSLNSVGNLLLHLNGNIRQYVLSSLGGEKDIRKRDDEFLNHAEIDINSLFNSHKEILHCACTIIQGISKKELKRQRQVQGFNLTGMQIIQHVVEHYSYHLGQIAFAVKLHTNKDLAFYKDLDLNTLNKSS